MMKKEYLIKIFRRYSSKSDDQLMPLIDEYVSVGRRRRALLKAILVVIVLSCVVGALMGIMKSIFSIGGSSFFSGVAGGIIGALSVMIVGRIQRIEIKHFLKSKKIEG